MWILKTRILNRHQLKAKLNLPPRKLPSGHRRSPLPVCTLPGIQYWTGVTMMIVMTALRFLTRCSYLLQILLTHHPCPQTRRSWKLHPLPARGAANVPRSRTPGSGMALLQGPLFRGKDLFCHTLFLLSIINISCISLSFFNFSPALAFQLSQAGKANCFQYCLSSWPFNLSSSTSGNWYNARGAYKPGRCQSGKNHCCFSRTGSALACRRRRRWTSYWRRSRRG